MTSKVLNSGAGGVEKKCKTEEEFGSGEIFANPKECASDAENTCNDVLCSSRKENHQPNISFTGGTNFTVNFNFSN